MKIHETCAQMTVFKLAFYSKKNNSKRSCEGGELTDLLRPCSQTRVSNNHFQSSCFLQFLTQSSQPIICRQIKHALQRIPELDWREIGHEFENEIEDDFKSHLSVKLMT
jgi:hypothetical protein